MKKRLARICLIGSYVWCVLMFPFGILGVFGGLALALQGDLKGYFILLCSYLLFTFGLDLVRTSRLLVQGKDLRREKLRQIRQSRLKNAKQNDDLQ